ncbi:MAG TPA: HEAT repeat domain-containing protein [Thermoanaerobaculia bacterium]|nr:HEAT repeat domain-containing protein [Thermoanaerobaculia bacterium]
MKRQISLPLLALLLAGPAAAAEIPGLNLANARIETASAASGLRSALRQAGSGAREPYWVGWSVPMIEGERYACCFGKDYGASTCLLEGKNQGWGNSEPKGSTRKPDQRLTVLLRMEGGQADEIRAFSESCPLDAGKRRFVWLGAAKPEESVALIADLADDRDKGHEKTSNAYAALALHRNSGADAALEKLASAPRSAKERDEPIFWLGQRRGPRGVHFLSGLATSDPDDDIREKALFSLSQSRQPEAVETVLEAARSDKSPKVRGHALFCLSQTDSPKAAPAILEAIKSDPEPSTRKQGIFALSQLEDEGIPLLIQLGRETEDREIRREAIFWLTQSKDPAAVAFLDKFLDE